MKRIILLLSLIAFPLTALAQNEDLNLYVKGGLNMHSITGDDISASDYMGIGYNVVVGYDKSLGQTENLFYGYEVGLGTRGSWYAKDGAKSKMVNHAMQIGVSLIYRVPIADNQSLDLHAGLGSTMDFAGKSTSEAKVGDEVYSSEVKLKDYGSGFRRSDIYIAPGITLWLGRFGMDVSWQRGLMPMQADTNTCASNILFRLAYKL